MGEAKASGNLGNTLKVLGQFDEAIACCEHHLNISKDLTDKVCILFLWKEGDDSIFHIFTKLPVPPQTAGIVGTHIVVLFYSEHYSFIFLINYCFMALLVMYNAIISLIAGMVCIIFVCVGIPQDDLQNLC